MRTYRYFSIPTLRWAKSLVAALCAPGERKTRLGLNDLAVYKAPNVHDYIVKAPNDAVTRIAFGAFIQAYITTDHEGYGEVWHRLPRGSRRVFPRETRTK